MEEVKKVVYSAFKTPDGTILHSEYRNDCVTYTDKNGKEYMLDGGIDYQRFTPQDDIEWLTLYENDSIEKIREVVGRSGYGKDGKGDYKYSLLKDMSDPWVEASIPYVGKDTLWGKIYQRELNYRKDNNIEIKDNLN